MITEVTVNMFVTNKPAKGNPDEAKGKFLDNMAAFSGATFPEMGYTAHDLDKRIYGAIINSLEGFTAPVTFHTEFFVNTLFPALTELNDSVNIVNMELSFGNDEGKPDMVITRDTHGVIVAGRRGYPLTFRPIDADWVVS